MDTYILRKRCKVVDNNDEDKLNRLKLRVYPELVDVKESLLPWATPFNGMSTSEVQRFDPIAIDSYVWCLIDEDWRDFYYLSEYQLNGRVDWDSLNTALSEISDLDSIEYDSTKLTVYEDGTIILNNIGSGEYAIVHSSGSYSVFKANGEVITKGESKVIMKVGDKTVELDDTNFKLNGSANSFVTYTQLNTALQSLITTLNTQLGTVQAGATAAIAASGLWLTPLTIGGLSLDISGSETSFAKTE